MKLTATYPDIEQLVVDYLAPLLDETVGVGLPDNWTKTSGNHLQVALDGTPSLQHPITATGTVRLVAWSASTSEAKALTAKAQGLLAAHPGGGGIATTRPLTGVLPARNPEHQAELASTTTAVTVRSDPIELGS